MFWTGEGEINWEGEEKDDCGYVRGEAEDEAEEKNQRTEEWGGEFPGERFPSEEVAKINYPENEREKGDKKIIMDF